MKTSKTKSLRLRVEPQQAKALAEMAAIYNTTVANYVRMLFAREMHILDVWGVNKEKIAEAIRRENPTEL